MFYTLFASRLFSRPCATPQVERPPPQLLEKGTDVLDDDEKKDLLKYFEIRDKNGSGSIPKKDIKQILNYLG